MKRVVGGLVGGLYACGYAVFVWTSIGPSDTGVGMLLVIYGVILALVGLVLIVTGLLMMRSARR